MRKPRLYRLYKELRKEIGNLNLAWKEYFKEFIYRHKLLIMMIIVSLGGLIFWVFMHFSGQAESEIFIISPNGIFLLNKWLSLIIGGGLLSYSLTKKYFLFKRIFDIIISFLGIVFLSPLFLIITILIKIDSYGPVFFRQERVGENGRIFTILKFRTMRNGAELETGPVWADDNDPRITGIGRFLRKSHLDELPQLINVFKGDMSIIGPRPEREVFLDMISKQIPHFKERLKVKPGITGLAQVRYRYGASIKDAGRKLKYDLIYIKRMCWLLDFQIILWTLGRVLTGEGAR
ncbi:MAG: sugar transferase [Candidatus Omnitrophica bacterium]|nr:sugar transferase [Candidatus Omnitrophota bacterium]MCM8826566.1 sugar transferase [Candidatus Omnitrophota bacterium]